MDQIAGNQIPRRLFPCPELIPVWVLGRSGRRSGEASYRKGIERAEGDETSHP